MLLRSALLLLALSLPAYADEAPPPPATPAPQETIIPSPQEAATPSPQEAASLQSFAAAHPECREWSDGCAVCKRDDTGAHCSLPGVACLPAADIVCKAP